MLNPRFTPTPPSPPTSRLPAVPAQSFLGELMDEDLQEFSQDKRLRHLLDNQEASLKLMANFMRETKEFRELVTNFMRENRESKCCGCHCVKERVRVLPKPRSGRLTMISTGDLWGSAVGDFWDLRDDAIASGSSNSVGDSGNMEIFGKEGDGFCRRQFKSKVGALAWGILPRELLKLFFNLRKDKGKMLLDQGKLGIIRKYVFKLYPCGQVQEDAPWHKCIVTIDKYLRRAKGKGNRQRQFFGNNFYRAHEK